MKCKRCIAAPVTIAPFPEMFRRRRSYTIIEFLVVTAVIGILIALALNG